MTSIADGSVKIQTTPESNLLSPSWFGEVVVISTYLRTQGVFKKINEQALFARKRFGRYELIDFRLSAWFGGGRLCQEIARVFWIKTLTSPLEPYA